MDRPTWHATKLKGALAAVTAAVVGVIANLTVWFTMHVLFAQVDQANFGPIRIYLPEWSQLDWRAAIIALLGLVLTFALKWDVLRVLVVSAVAGLAFMVM